MPMIEYALNYARLGYLVLPLQPGGKRPHPKLTPRGLKQASVNPATLEAWWRACPECGVGLLPGPEVVVLDADGPEVVAALLARWPELEAAPLQRTPRGGGHFFVRVPPHVGASLRTGRAKGLSELGPVDVKGLGRGYVAAWPTRLPTGPYTWERPMVGPEELPPALSPCLGSSSPATAASSRGYALNGGGQSQAAPRPSALGVPGGGRHPSREPAQPPPGPGPAHGGILPPGA